MATTTVSIEEAQRDFAALIARVTAGERIVIASDDRQVAVISAPDSTLDPSVEATLQRLAESRGRLGYTPMMGSDFADDMEEIIRSRRPAGRTVWD